MQTKRILTRSRAVWSKAHTSPDVGMRMGHRILHKFRCWEERSDMQHADAPAVRKPRISAYSMQCSPGLTAKLEAESSGRNPPEMSHDPSAAAQTVLSALDIPTPMLFPSSDNPRDYPADARSAFHCSRGGKA